MKAYDLAGRVFGKLTVIEKIQNPNNKKKTFFWLCRCECGNTSIVSSSSLITGKSTQCYECGQVESAKNRRINLIGQKFGKLTVIDMEYGNKDKNGKYRTYCICRCECGNIVRRTPEKLRCSNLPSCGCAAKEIQKLSIGTNVDGLKFGKLTVLETLWDESPVKLKCICDCGDIFIGVKSDIVSGHTKSCGCLQKNIGLLLQKDWTNHVSEYGVKFIKQHSKSKTGQWLWECECGLCGDHFIGVPGRINSGYVTSCGCRKRSSKEEYIRDFLLDMEVDFKEQYMYDDCVYLSKLKFDFAIMDNDKVLNLIEYDGIQHSEIIDYFGGEEEYLKTVIRDNIKNEYCKKNKISLLRLPHTLTNDEIKQQILNILNDCRGSVAI